MKRLTLILLTTFLFAITIAGTGFAQPVGDDVYVSPTGSDDTGAGTEDDPFQTIMFGINHVADDGTVHLDEGTYDKHIDDDSKDNDISIEKDVTIQGAGKDQTFIDGNSLYQIFSIKGDYTVTLKDLTIQNCDPNTDGGAIILKDGTLNLINCNFINNAADSSGGAIASSGTLTVTNCYFNNNQATGTGGAISNFGILTVTGSTFTGNSANQGGAIFTYPGTVNVIGNNFLDNGGNAITIYPTAAGGEAAGAPTISYNVNVNRIVGNTPYGLYIYLDDLINGAAASDSIPITLIDATNNWWGSNNDPRTLSDAIYDPLNYADTSKWLVLKIGANPSNILYGSTSLVTSSVIYNNLGEDTSSIGHIPDGTPLTIITNIGNVGSKSVTLYTASGIVSAILRANDGLGIAHLYAILDGFTTPLPALVEITAAATSVSAKTVGMQVTGAPLVPLLLAVLLMMGGMVIPRMKK